MKKKMRKKSVGRKWGGFIKNRGKNFIFAHQDIWEKINLPPYILKILRSYFKISEHLFDAGFLFFPRRSFSWVN